MLSHLNFAANARSIVSYLGLTQRDRVMCVLPFHYVYGLSLLHTHLAVGGALADDGSAGSSAGSTARRPFGLYVHVPFCATRCGYCDFNTYTSDELGPGANRSEYAGTAIAELQLAAEVLGPDRPAVQTVFVGGGTPSRHF